MSNQNPSKQVDLLQNVLDHQDVNGDTCLLLAAKSGSAKVVRFLLGYGARDDLENINKETAKIVLQNNCILPEYAPQQEHLWQQLSYQQNGNVNQFNQEMPTQFVQLQMDGINNTNQFQQILETPVQPSFRNGGVGETPDTQRTAIQEDDMEDDNETARVDPAHLDSLNDNKENVFMDGKTYEVSTPISKDSNGLQPLGVISENAKTVSETTKKSTYSSVQQFRKPNPPKLDSEGRLVSGNDKKLSMKDLSSMLCTMISSLSDSHDQTLQALEEECKKIQEQLEQKRSINDETLTKLKTMLKKIGLVEFDSVEEGKKLLGDELVSLSKQVEHQELALRRALERNQAYHLANTVQELESAYTETERGKEEESKEQNWKYAVQLTQLQQERTKLMNKLTCSMKQFGIDTKMYKYRKLISSSCGLKVEEIDGLIDGIEESLVESIP
jgi:regulatory protein SWI4